MQSKVLGSRYELLEQIGMGGMAIVYKAMDKMLNRYVAVKVLREEFKENEEFIRRFNVESQAAASLSHQNIVQIYDVGEEDGLHYIVMELLEGETLKQYISSKGGKLTVREATNFSMQICRALEHAHSKHVVHRDIKPQNIIITESGKLKVADFGIARAANNSTMVNAGKNAIGSAHYLSPEQARGGYTDLRSDIYSLGVVMYEMFTGALPFDGEESISVVLQHLQEEATLPCEVNPDLPAGIEAIIVRCMKKEQRLRYNNATEILQDLVKVYQNPSIAITHLNAYDSEGMEDIPKRSPMQKRRASGQGGKNQKKKANRGLMITIIIGLAAVIALMIVGIKLLFPQSEEVRIPNVLGMKYDDALLAVSDASTDSVEFTLVQSSEKCSDEPKGTIISQDPEGNFNVKKSREIKVVVSKGPEALVLASYKNKHYKSVKEKLEDKGLKVTIEEEDNEDYDEGIIFKQFPSDGKTMAEGEEVILYVSKGTEQKIVPDLVGKTRAQALLAIEEKGLKVGSVKEASSEKYPKGQVFRQSIDAYETVPAGTQIDLYISTGEKAEGDDETDKPPVKPDKNPKPKTVSLKLTSLPKGKPVTVKLVCDGVPIYESDITTSTGTETISFQIEKTSGLLIYYDGVYIRQEEVKY